MAALLVAAAREVAETVLAAMAAVAAAEAVMALCSSRASAWRVLARWV